MSFIPSQSIAYIFVGAFALLTLAFLVVLAPLIWPAVLHFAPDFEPLNRLITFGRLAIASLALLRALILAHKSASRAKIAARHCSRNFADLRHVDRRRHCLRFLPRRIRAQLCHHLRWPRLGDDRAHVYMIASIFIFGGELNAAILRAKRKRDGNLKVERAMRGIWCQ
jgi:membrane protein